MLFEIIIFLLIGILFGTFTGLIPGIHINLISSLLVSLTTIIYLEPIYSITFISSMAITHTFVDFIPSIFLGCPDTDTELSILPGHKLLMDKRGFEAISHSNQGSLIAIFILIIILTPAIFLLDNLYEIIEKLIPFILIFVSFSLVFSDKFKFNSLKIFLLSGILGYSVNFLQIEQPLLPLLTGLFGASTIIISIKNNTIIPEQKITKTKVKLKKPILASIISAPICGFLPGLGSAQAAIIGKNFIKMSQRQFLILLGIINTLVMSFSFIALYSIQKTRTGSAVAINELVGKLKIEYLILILITIIFSGVISYFITEKLAKYFSRKIHKVNYKKIGYSTLFLLLLIIFLISRLNGLIVFFVSTLMGIYSINCKVRKTNMMGVLIIPTIIWYLF